MSRQPNEKEIQEVTKADSDIEPIKTGAAAIGVNGLRSRASVIGLLLFLAISGGAAIWYTSSAFIEVAARTTFIIGSALNLAVFLAIIIQAYIYWGQRNLMHKQWKAMQDSLEVTREIVAQNRLAMIAAEQSAAVAKEAFYVGEPPYFGTSKIEFRWATTIVKNTGTGPVQRVTGQPELIITFMNGGKTPAWHFSALPHLELGEAGQVDRGWITLNAVHGNECPDAENTFYPSGSQKCIKYRGRGEFSSGQIEAINARTQTLFLIIDLGYTDMRNDRQTRNWIRCLNPTTGRFGDCGAIQD